MAQRLCPLPHLTCSQASHHLLSSSSATALILVLTLSSLNHHVCVCVCVRVHVLGCVQLFGTLWTIACQAPLSMGFSRQEHWSGCHAFLQRIFLTQGSNLHLLHLLLWQVGSLTIEPPGKHHHGGLQTTASLTAAQGRC